MSKRRACICRSGPLDFIKDMLFIHFAVNISAP
jgi:hypothetical protein